LAKKTIFLDNLKILYISYDGMTDPLGQSQVIPYLQGLSAAGHRITLLSAEKESAFKKLETVIKAIFDKAGINWKPLPYTSRPPVISTIKDIQKLRANAFKEIRENGIEVVHCRSYISALVGLSAKRKFGVKFVFDMRGFWADERIDGGIWNLKNPLFRLIYNFFKQKEKQFLKEADAVISLTENARNEILSWKSFSKIPLTVIPCCADLDLYSRSQIDPEKLDSLRQNLKIPSGAFVLSYLGSLGTWYLMDEMLLFFKQLLLRDTQAVFLFITKDNKEMVIKAARRIGIPDSQLFITAADRSEVPLYAALSNASIFFIKPLYSKKASSPTKMGELMALGIPLICNSNVGDVESIISDNANGIIVHEFTETEFNKVLDDLPSLLSADPSRNIICANKYYSLKEGVKTYLKVYESLM